MKIKTSELEGIALDWAVSLITNPEWTEEDRALNTYDYADIGDPGDEPYTPSENWAQGGPIIDCVDMQFWKWGGSPRGEMQCATLPTKEEHGTRLTTYFGETKLVAGLRAYVASKLGDEVEIPDALIR